MNTKWGSPRRWYFQTDGFILEQGQDAALPDWKGDNSILWFGNFTQC